jgi:alanine racemase
MEYGKLNPVLDPETHLVSVKNILALEKLGYNNEFTFNGNKEFEMEAEV